MKDKRKIILGVKDVFPTENKDIFLNVELSRTSDDLIKEIIDNNFNILEQFNSERELSLKFCVYGNFNSVYSDTENIEIEIKTNHEDIIHTPRIGAGAYKAIVQKIKTKPLSNNSNLSKNIFNKKRSSFYFLFEISNFYNNFGETKSLKLIIDDKNKNIYGEVEIPFLYFDADGDKIPFGTNTIDIDLDGNEQIINNDFPFLYDIHWVKAELNIDRPRQINFKRSITEIANNITIQENSDLTNFIVALDSPSLYGKEEVEIYIKNDNTIKNPNKDYNFNPIKLSWLKNEQYKNVSLDLLDDIYSENQESIVFGFRELKFAESGNNDIFTVFINDNDKPVSIGFEFVSKTIKESDDYLTINLNLDKVVTTPNQYIEVIIDDLNSTAINLEDYSIVDPSDESKLVKRVLLTQGSSIASFEIKLFDDFKYEFDKTIIFRFQNPTQNVVIDESKSVFTITINDSMTTKYTTYKIPGTNIQQTNGIFIMSDYQPSNNIPASLKIGSSTNVINFNENINCHLKIINKGEPIIYGDVIVGTNQIVLEKEIINGSQDFYIDLPSNGNLNEELREFDSSNYEFTFYDFPNFNYTLGISSSNIDALQFNDLIIPSKPLSALVNKGEKQYYLVTRMSNVLTRLNLNSDFIEYAQINSIISSNNILINDSEDIIREKLISGGGYYTFGVLLNQALLNIDIQKIKDFFTLLETHPEKYTISLDTTNLRINAKMNGTIIMTKIFENNINQNSVINFFNNSTNSNNPNTKINSVEFEEEPVTFTYYTPPNHQSSFISIEPIN